MNSELTGQLRFSPHSRFAYAVSVFLMLLCVGCALAHPTPYDGDGENADMCVKENVHDTDEQWWEPKGAFVRVPDSPLMEPPTVRIFVETNPDGRFADGMRYTADWIHKDNRLTQRPVIPVPWPERTQGKACSIRILTDFRPFSVVVIGYDEIDPVSGEPPTADVDTRYECTRFGPESCTYPHPDGYVEIVGVPQDILDQPYVIVFAIWPIGLPGRGDQPDDPSTLAASWLFRFSD